MARVRWVTIFALCAATLGCVAPARAAVPRGFLGTVSDELVDASPHSRQAALHKQAAAGIQTLRQTFDWTRVERSRGHYAFGVYDGLVLDAAKEGIGVTPPLSTPPRFSPSRPRRHARRGVSPPRRHADMARFATAMARRYGAGGTLWKEHPGLADHAVHSWQIWNEPNLAVYWASGVSPPAYTRLLRAAGHAMKDVDPGAEIVTAGLPNSTLAGSMSFSRFVKRMYRAGGRDAFDSLAIHPYAVSSRGALLAVRSARRLMDRSGDRSGGLQITEI